MEPAASEYDQASVSRLFVAIYDPFMRGAEGACLAGWRADLLGQATGEVLEIGAGTGANLAAYTEAVTRLVLTEPDPDMLARLKTRLGARRGETLAAQADELPFPDASFDFVVSTLVLCSVRDVARTLAEVKRVLRPGGRLLFMEHVAADDQATRRLGREEASEASRRPSRPTRLLAWQRRLEPLWVHVSGNCHLTRRTHDAIRAAGFTVEQETRESMRKALPILRPTVRGVARRP